MGCLLTLDRRDWVGLCRDGLVLVLVSLPQDNNQEEKDPKQQEGETGAKNDA